MRADDFEYPDTAGYPDGRGFLDEGTAPTGPDPVATELDLPDAEADDEVRVIHDPETRTYQALLGIHQIAVMHAAEDAGVVTITATFVEASARGKGIATEFIAHVLDDLREADRRIVVECPEVSRFLERQPEYASLLA
jgi:predicted GNAT family acetyltransferase